VTRLAAKQTRSNAHARVRRLLVAGQIGVSVVLLCGASLLLKSFRNLERQKPWNADPQCAYRAHWPQRGALSDRPGIHGFLSEGGGSFRALARCHQGGYEPIRCPPTAGTAECVIPRSWSRADRRLPREPAEPWFRVQSRPDISTSADSRLSKARALSMKNGNRTATLSF